MGAMASSAQIRADNMLENFSLSFVCDVYNINGISFRFRNQIEKRWS